MSKSILIIDTPENCEDCPLFRTAQDFNATIHYCMPYPGKELFMVNEKDISGNCPLKSMPQKKDTRVAYKKEDANYYEIFTKNYVRGWNDCIGTILENNNETNI